MKSWTGEKMRLVRRPRPTVEVASSQEQHALGPTAKACRVVRSEWLGRVKLMTQMPLGMVLIHSAAKLGT